MADRLDRGRGRRRAGWPAIHRRGRPARISGGAWLVGESAHRTTAAPPPARILSRLRPGRGDLVGGGSGRHRLDRAGHPGLGVVRGDGDAGCALGRWFRSSAAHGSSQLPTSFSARGRSPRGAGRCGLVRPVHNLPARRHQRRPGAFPHPYPWVGEADLRPARGGVGRVLPAADDPRDTCEHRGA